VGDLARLLATRRPSGFCLAAIHAGNTFCMDPDTDSNRIGPGSVEPGDADWRAWAGIAGHGAYGDPDSYWRRRVLILAGGLAVVGLITWGLSALLGAPSPVKAAGPGVPASLTARNTLPPAAYGAPAGASRAASRPLSASAVTSSPPAASARQAGPGACAQGSVVVSLFTTQAEYGPAQEPRFLVYAVSTAPGACELTYGPSVVRIVVTRAGQVLWDSAACRPRGQEPASAVQLAPGVPQMAAISWNRGAGTPGCAGSLPAGTLDAVAMADGRTSPVRTFTVRTG
jgi:hypothetical protein